MAAASDRSPPATVRRLRDDDPIPVLTDLLHRAYAAATDLIALYERWGFRRVGEVRWDVVNYPSVLLSRVLRPGD